MGTFTEGQVKMMILKAENRGAEKMLEALNAQIFPDFGEVRVEAKVDRLKLYDRWCELMGRPR